MEMKVDYHIVVVHLALHVREIITDTTSRQSFCIVVVILVSIQNYYSKFAVFINMMWTLLFNIISCLFCNYRD